MPDCIMFVGLDVHKDTIAVALAPAGSPEVRSYGIIPGDLEAVDKGDSGFWGQDELISKNNRYTVPRIRKTATPH